jgi:hypothetical protein
MVGAVLLVGLLAAFLVLTIANGALFRGVAVASGTFLGCAAIAWIVLALVGVIRGGEFWRAEPIWTHLASYASTILVGTALLATIGKSASQTQLRSAFWFLLVAVGGLIGLFAPGGIIFFIFPPLLALAGIVAARWWKPAERVGSAAAILFLYATWGGTLGLLEEVLDNGPMWVFAPLASLIVLPVLIEGKPMIARAGALSAALVSGALALAGWTIVAAAPAYSVDRQQRFTVEHVADASTGKSWWSVLNDGAALPKSFPGEWKRGELPYSDRQRWLGSAPADPTSRAPAVELLSKSANGPQRTISIRLASKGNDNVMLVAPPDSRIISAGAPGFVRPMEQGGSGRFVIACSGRSCDGAVLTLTTERLLPIGFIILGSRRTLPPSAATLLAARPRFARPQYTPDESIAFSRVNL